MHILTLVSLPEATEATSTFSPSVVVAVIVAAILVLVMFFIVILYLRAKKNKHMDSPDITDGGESPQSKRKLYYKSELSDFRSSSNGVENVNNSSNLSVYSMPSNGNWRPINGVRTSSMGSAASTEQQKGRSPSPRSQHSREAKMDSLDITDGGESTQSKRKSYSKSGKTRSSSIGVQNSNNLSGCSTTPLKGSGNRRPINGVKTGSMGSAASTEQQKRRRDTNPSLRSQHSQEAKRRLS